MRTCLLVARQIASDWLLWILVIVSIIINSVLVVCDPTGARICQTANNLVSCYGGLVSSSNVSSIEYDMNTILDEASDAYHDRYGEGNLDALDLYHAGYLQDEEYEIVMLMQQMLAYGHATLDDGSEVKYFIVSELSGSRDVLYKKILPFVSLELIIIAVYVVLKTLETGRVTRTAPLEYSTRFGKHIDIVKIIASFAVIALICLLVNICAIALFCLRYPGSISTSSIFPIYISKMSPALYLSESGYLLLWIGTEFLVICIYTILAAATGLVFRNSLVGLLSLVALFSGLLGFQMISSEEHTQWNPVGLFLIFKEGTITVQSDKWFIAAESEYILCGSELLIVVTWLAFAIIILDLAWRFFQGKEFGI